MTIIVTLTPFLATPALFLNTNNRYTDYHAGATVCGPSRAAMLTGRMGQRTGVLHNFVPNSIGGLPTTEILLSEYMKGRSLHGAV